MENWKIINDEDVKHVWIPAYDDKCAIEAGIKEVEWNPDMYNVSGTPICPFCGNDFIYSHTLIREK